MQSGRGEPQILPGAGFLREVILGAQDNLTNVLATVLGVAIGSGKASIVALAGLSSGVAEAISMGGVLYTSTRAELDLRASGKEGDGPPEDRSREPGCADPLRAALVCFAAAAIAAVIPLAPFAVLSIRPAMVACVLLSGACLFALGGWKGAVTRRPWWRDGLQLVLIGTLAAVASALIGAALRTHGT